MLSAHPGNPAIPTITIKPVRRAIVVRFICLGSLDQFAESLAACLVVGELIP